MNWLIHLIFLEIWLVISRNIRPIVVRAELFVERVLTDHIAIRKTIPYRLHRAWTLRHYLLLIRLGKGLISYLIVESVFLMERVLKLWLLIHRGGLNLTLSLLKARNITFDHVFHLLLTSLWLTLAGVIVFLTIWSMGCRYEHLLGFLFRGLVARLVWRF